MGVVVVDVFTAIEVEKEEKGHGVSGECGYDQKLLLVPAAAPPLLLLSSIASTRSESVV